MSTVNLCFVCLGNICRSPTAEGIMLHLIEREGLSSRFVVDSAGTAAYHVGERPDPRTLATAKMRGVALPSIARRFVREDLGRFHYVLAMDDKNRSALLKLARTDEERARIQLLRSFDANADALHVPDPYYGGPEGFEHVFDVCMAACEGLLSHLRERHSL